MSLFSDEAKKEQLYAAVDRIRQRFGEQGITKARLLRASSEGKNR